MKTLSSSVGFQAPDGTLLANGSLVITLPDGMYEILAGGGQVYGNSVIINLDANAKIPGTPQIWAGDELAGHPIFAVQLCALKGGLTPVASAQWDISGGSPIDLSLMIAIAGSGGVSLPSPAPGYVVVPYAATMSFAFSNSLPNVITFETTLTGNVSSSSLALAGKGQIVIFKIIQDAVGNRAFPWPSNVKNAQAVDPAPNTRSVQAFINNGTFLDPIGDMTSNI
jgi:hypothetical protein